jgi:hypothetical protein
MTANEALRLLDKPVESAALLASISGFVFRTLAIVFNWKTMAVGDRGAPPRESSQSERRGYRGVPVGRQRE